MKGCPIMKFYQNIHELIGETPIMEITHFPLPDQVRIFAKLEYFNPGGVKDRLGQELWRKHYSQGM